MTRDESKSEPRLEKRVGGMGQAWFVFWEKGLGAVTDADLGAFCTPEAKSAAFAGFGDLAEGVRAAGGAIAGDLADLFLTAIGELAVLEARIDTFAASDALADAVFFGAGFFLGASVAWGCVGGGLNQGSG